MPIATLEARRATDLVRAFRGLHALVIGDAMLDTYLEGTASRLCSEGPVPVVRKSGEENVPGGAANTAANLSSLGANVEFVSVVGDDAAGHELRRSLRLRGVNDRSVLTDRNGSTLHKVRILADDQYIVRFDAGEIGVVSPGLENALIAALTAAFERCDLVVVSDYCYGVVTDAVIDQLYQLRRRRPCPLVVDSKRLERLARAMPTLVTPNHVEACQLVEPGMDSDAGLGLSAMERIGREVLLRSGSESAAITLGAKGVLLVDAERSTHFSAHPVMKANDVGAGDSFSAAASLVLACGGTADEAMRIGVQAAGISVTKRRTAVVRHQELLQRVSLDRSGASSDVNELASILTDERRRGRRVVFTNGVFDILHAGHVHFLREAKALGDILVVAVNSDRSARLLKGENRPINGERDRVALVGALEPVDHVVVFDEELPSETIRALIPDIHVKGGDYAGEPLPEAEAVAEVNGEVVILPLFESASTTEMLDRIVRLLA